MSMVTKHILNGLPLAATANGVLSFITGQNVLHFEPISGNPINASPDKSSTLQYEWLNTTANSIIPYETSPYTNPYQGAAYQQAASSLTYAGKFSR
ncbi:hypothetical protein BC835DRAFT_1425089 [Cytidiella melzeri]|nr:hypothetical protein BC835DRAFT_1425089 [Cytidiella melzeri]